MEKKTSKKTSNKASNKTSNVAVKRGRKAAETDEEIAADVDAYLTECEKTEAIPQVIRFARRHNMTKQNLYKRASESQVLIDSIKKITEEKELILEEKALVGAFVPSMAIFSLKQLGWRDRTDSADNSTEEESGGVIMMPEVINGK